MNIRTKMKPLTLLSILVLLSFSCRKEKLKSVTVIKACEGTFLRSDNKDHLICNEEILDSYKDGSVIRATFVKDNDCSSGRAHCSMVHAYDVEPGNFRIIKIK